MPQVNSVISNTDLPKSADVVVIGGGIAGVTAALELAERGLKVVLVEKGQIAAEQSSRNWGWCRQMGRDPREIPLMQESLRLWHGMNARINADTGFQVCGIAYLIENEREAAKYEAWLANHARPAGVDSQIISGAALDKAVPGAAVRFKSALYTQSDGRAEPSIAVPAMAHALQKAGGQIFSRTAARGVETQAGRVSAVVTERDTIMCGTVLLAGGYWSRHFLTNLGIRFPQLGVVNSVLRTAPLENGHTTTFSGSQSAARKRQDGGFTIAHNHLSVADITPAHFKYFGDFWPTLKTDWRDFRFRLGRRFITEAKLKTRWKLDETSPFEQLRILNPAPVASVLDDALNNLIRNFPAFGPVQVAERWAGMIDVMPDVVPVIGPVASLPGLYLTTGFSGHGFGIGPGAGKLAAQIITGETPCVDPMPFRLERFS